MNPSRRHGVNKSRSVRSFNKGRNRTKSINSGVVGPMRGGIRL